MIKVLEGIRTRSGNESKICLFQDNAPMHKALAVKGRAEAEDVNIKLCYNIPYRPDLNPCELLFRKAKNEYRRQIDRLKTLNREWDQ